MVEIIKEAGIFIVIAQAVLILVPGESYEKYVKVIIGLVMIVKLAQPIVAFFSEDAKEASFALLFRQTDSLYEASLQEAGKWESEDGRSEILDGIGEELKEKLNERPQKGYLVENVKVDCGSDREVSYVTITVGKTEPSENRKIQVEKIEIGGEGVSGNGEEEVLKEYYGQILGMEQSQIVIRMQ